MEEQHFVTEDLACSIPLSTIALSLCLHDQVVDEKAINLLDRPVPASHPPLNGRKMNTTHGTQLVCVAGGIGSKRDDAKSFDYEDV